jgi:hypothetical protein
MTKPAEMVVVKRRFIYLIILSLITSILSPLGTIVYANYIDTEREKTEREQDQNWCELITSLDDRYRKLPEDATAEAIDLGMKISHLRTKLNCQ